MRFRVTVPNALGDVRPASRSGCERQSRTDLEGPGPPAQLGPDGTIDRLHQLIAVVEVGEVDRKVAQRRSGDEEDAVGVVDHDAFGAGSGAGCRRSR